MAGYTKLFNSILASTIWRADDKTRIVWITLLAMADRQGICEGSIPGLADFARVSILDCEAALRVLQSPDPYSRSQEHDGRRIAPIEGGWRLLNHGKYRQRLSQDERRDYLKIRQREHRAKKAVNTVSTLVDNVSYPSTRSTQAEAEASPDPQAVRPTRRTPIHGAEHRAHASCGRACVPAFLHRQFVTALGGDEDASDLRLRDWYLIVEQGFRPDDAVPSDVIKFWRVRFDVEFVKPGVALQSDAASVEALRAEILRQNKAVAS